MNSSLIVASLVFCNIAATLRAVSKSFRSPLKSGNFSSFKASLSAWDALSLWVSSSEQVTSLQFHQFRM